MPHQVSLSATKSLLCVEVIIYVLQYVEVIIYIVNWQVVTKILQHVDSYVNICYDDDSSNLCNDTSSGALHYNICSTAYIVQLKTS